jgi:rubredoxin
LFEGCGALEKWECTVCGYIYDPEIGDVDHGVSAGTPFEALPENWVCPVCGASKELFIKKSE